MKLSAQLRFLLIGAIGAAAGLATACATRIQQSEPVPSAAGTIQRPIGATATTSATTTAAAPVVPRPPDLSSDPVIRIFLAEAPRLTVTLLREATIEGRRVVGGTYGIGVASGTGSSTTGSGMTGDGIDLAGTTVGPQVVLRFAGDDRRTPHFRATLTPPSGAPQTLEFAGDLVLRRDGDRVELIEETDLEGYLLGVVPTEMNPGWPVEALKAQAIAARSYAAHRAQERFDKPWQLHWHYTVDMAYAGIPPRPGNASDAVSATRGQFLTYRGKAIPALFHASNGGKSEAAGNVFERMTTRDGTPMAAQMPVVIDDANESGCRGLKMTTSHWRWKENLPARKVLTALQGWAGDHPEDRLRFGSVLTDIRILSRHPDSGRVALMEITSKDGRKTLTTTMRAGDFRLAVGPGDMRSTWLDKCLLVSGKGGTLVLNGRGFGHGVGLSQVSAWQLAKQGETAAQILRRYYPTAELVDRY